MNMLTTRDGTRIYYNDWGQGQPIVFSHGWPLTADAWDAQMLFFSGRGFRAVAHDRRGHGRSDQPGFGNDMDTYADDRAELIEALDLRDVVLIGHSTGGGEVARYVGRHGTSRLAKAVLIDAITPQMVKTPTNPAGAPIEVFEQIRAGVAANRSSFYQDLTTPFFGANRNGSQVTQGMRDAFWFQSMQGGIRGQYDCTLTWELDYSADLRKFDVPTLVIHGDDDQIVPIDATGRRALDFLPHGVLKVYPGGNH
ncbi:MAG TPA: alpha/beta hydrolase, partial [Allosphingosinicella sp.]